MNEAEVISFDLDGTLVAFDYTMGVWEIGIPHLYAEKNRVSFSEAVANVTAEYARVSDAALEWYDITYWFNYFDLPGTGERLMKEHRKKIQLFPEVREVIEELGRHYDLIITSNAAREFVEMEVKETGIEDYFSRIFSATGDFGQVKSTPQFYSNLCEIIGVIPSQMIHLGDHYKFDYLVPRQAGIKTYYLDRDGEKPKNSHTVKDLKEFIGLLK